MKKIFLGVVLFSLALSLSLPQTYSQTGSPNNFTALLNNATVFYPVPNASNLTLPESQSNAICSGPTCSPPHIDINLRDKDGNQMRNNDIVSYKKFPLTFTLTVPNPPGARFTHGDCEAIKNGAVFHSYDSCLGNGRTYVVPLNFNGFGNPAGNYQLNTKQYACYEWGGVPPGFCVRQSAYSYTGISFRVTFP